MLDGAELVVLHVEPSQPAARPTPEVGQRLPPHATAAGKALLAALDDAALERLLGARLAPRTPRTLASPAELKAELAQIRRLGYAYDAEEYAAGLYGVAAPVLDATGRAVGAIEVMLPSARLEKAALTRVTTQLLAAAAEASALRPPAEAAWLPGHVRVAWSMGTLHQQAYQIMHRAVERLCATVGADVIWTDAREDAIRQAVDVGRLLELRPDVILIHPAHALHAEQLFTQAAQAGVPAINFQRPVRGRHITFFVGGNTYEQGRLTAAFVARALGGRGNLAIIGGDLHNDNARNLAQGIYDELRPHRALKVLTDQPCTLWSREVACELTEAALREHGDSLHAFLAANDEMAGGVAEVLAAHGRAGRVLLVGGDGDLDALQRIHAGIQHGTAFQNWIELAKETLRFAISLARNEVDRAQLQHRSIFYSPPGPPAYVKDLPYIFVEHENVALLERFWQQAQAI
jgi:ABC-type sugar transport system substrate-binding protein